MKLLFDENVSPKLAQVLAKEYPGSLHVTEAGLRGAADQEIWDYARAGGFAIVSKDTDFQERSLASPSPKVIWLAVGNAGTVAIAGFLKRESARVNDFEKQQTSFLVLSLGAGAS